MALVIKDRVKESSVSTGTGTITLDGATGSFQSFSAVGDGNSTYYAIVGQSTTEWEVGIGIYTASGTTLSRDTILASSAGGSAVNFSAGEKDVFVTYPAERAVDTNLPQTLTNKTIDGASNTLSNISVASGGTGTDTLTANNVILGNGTNAPLFVAPGTTGNVLTSDGTTWTSTAPAASGATKGQAIAFSIIFGL
jgi:hypothetical protein